jgi:hypothetical protein
MGEADRAGAADIRSSRSRATTYSGDRIGEVVAGFDQFKAMIARRDALCLQLFDIADYIAC